MWLVTVMVGESAHLQLAPAQGAMPTLSRRHQSPVRLDRAVCGNLVCRYLPALLHGAIQFMVEWCWWRLVDILGSAQGVAGTAGAADSALWTPCRLDDRCQDVSHPGAGDDVCHAGGLWRVARPGAHARSSGCCWRMAHSKGWLANDRNGHWGRSWGPCRLGPGSLGQYQAQFSGLRGICSRWRNTRRISPRAPRDVEGNSLPGSGFLWTSPWLALRVMGGL